MALDSVSPGQVLIWKLAQHTCSADPAALRCSARNPQCAETKRSFSQMVVGQLDMRAICF